MRLIDAPVGVFVFQDELVLKTEYMTNIDGVYIPDCYILSTGEKFWGGMKSTEDFKTKYNNLDVEVIDTLKVQPDESKYEYHYDHTDCIWYRPEARNRCPVTCAQYRDGWNDAMNYIFRDGKGYRPYRRDKRYEEGREE